MQYIFIIFYIGIFFNNIYLNNFDNELMVSNYEENWYNSGQVFFLNTGKLIIFENNGFFPYSAKGFLGEARDGCAFEVDNGILKELFLLVDGNFYEVLSTRRLIQVLQIKYNNIYFSDTTSLFYNNNNLCSGYFKCNYNTLSSCGKSLDSDIFFRDGQIWKIIEYDDYQRPTVSYDLELVMKVHALNGAFWPSYANGSWNPSWEPIVKPFPIPYKLISCPSWIDDIIKVCAQ